MRRFVMAVLCLSAAPALVAREKALGFVVKAEETKFYKSAEGDEVLATLPKGESLAGCVTGIVEADVQAFSYNCGCGPKESWPQEPDPCSPLLAANGLRTTKYEWNICFKEGRDAKLAAAPAATPAPAAAAPAAILKDL